MKDFGQKKVGEEIEGDLEVLNINELINEENQKKGLIDCDISEIKNAEESISMSMSKVFVNNNNINTNKKDNNPSGTKIGNFVEKDKTKKKISKKEKKRREIENQKKRKKKKKIKLMKILQIHQINRA